MKKRKILVILIIIILVVVGLITAFILNNDKNYNSETKPTSYTDNPSDVKIVVACEVFSLDDAKNILGDTAKLQQSYDGKSDSETKNGQANSAKLPKKAPKTIDNDNKQFTTEPDLGEKAASTLCSYWKPSRTADEADKNTIAVAVRSSINATAKKDFEATQKDSTMVEGLGEGAYWKAGKNLRGKEYGQLYVLKGQNLLVISAGNNQDNSKNVAQVILDRL